VLCPRERADEGTKTMANKSIRKQMSPEIEEQRAAIVATPDQCDNLLPHASHSREFRMQNWLGGGYENRTCPGVRAA
jgi:hypothetical protein